MSRVFIVLAAWEAAGTLLERQVASLSEQTFQDWNGIVVDDASSKDAQKMIAERVGHESRLRFVPQSDRVGFYRNFERGLAMAPADCDYVAFCDQDDRWVPHKLERQVETMDALPGAQLCYSDLCLVDKGGKPVADSFWLLRPNGSRFREVLYNNVVTGSTALFRRPLVDMALPFPTDPGGAFHDHWLALCAMVSGDLAYLDEPLVDYTQHARNVLGAQALEHVGRGSLKRFLRSAAAHPREVAMRLNKLAAYAVGTDAKLRSFAVALRARFTTLPPDAESALRPFLRSGRGTRVLDLAVPTALGSFAAGEESNLEPLKIALGMAWDALR